MKTVLGYYKRKSEGNYEDCVYIQTNDISMRYSSAPGMWQPKRFKPEILYKTRKYFDIFNEYLISLGFETIPQFNEEIPRIIVMLDTEDAEMNWDIKRVRIRRKYAELKNAFIEATNGEL